MIKWIEKNKTKSKTKTSIITNIILHCTVYRILISKLYWQVRFANVHIILLTETEPGWQNKFFVGHFFFAKTLSILETAHDFGEQVYTLSWK